jgi:hypothetical protein
MLISRSLLSKGSTCHTAPSLRLFILNSLQAYRHFFFSKSCTCDVCDRSRLPSSWLGSHGDYSTAPAAPSLRPLIPSGSLIRYKPVQVYHHHYLFQVLCFDVSSSVSEADDPSTMSTHSLPVTQTNTRLFASPWTCVFVRRPHTMFSCFPNVAHVSCFILWCRFWLSCQVL